MKRFRFVIFALLLFLSAAIFIHTKEEASSSQEELETQLLRFHVIANSDSETDQSQKLKVKESVLQTLSPYLMNIETKEEAKHVISFHMGEIIETAQQVLSSLGSTDSVNASITTCYFPTKTYGDLTFPPGEYEALVITIGEAKGKNWWCVMYPPLCFVDASYGTVPEESKDELKGLLTKDTYDSLTAKEKPVKVGFKILSFFERLFG